MKAAIVVAGALAVVVWASPAPAQTLLDRQGYRPLVSDQRAYRVGDRLTVLVTEAASASTTARTTTDKSASVAAAGRAGSDGNNYEANAEAELAENFKGGGKIERTGKLLAQITVTVRAVDRNGDLLVQGEQEMLVNEERQWLRVEGRVRPHDVRADNTVLSPRLADAKLQYTGKGLLAEKQKPGLLSRFLSWIGLL